MSSQSARQDMRQFGTTDDVAIFMDDTFDSELTKCVTNSPSAMAILSPQRMPQAAAHTYVDVTEYDPSQILPGYAAGMSSSARKHRRAFASDITNGMSSGGGVRLTFGRHGATASGAEGSLNTSTTSAQALPQPPPQPAASALIAAQQVELERLEKERNRYCKMHEHQKALYEEMSMKQHETHQKLQEKIVEVVALSTRNEESKRFIRQLKREILDCKTRTLDLHNRALEDTRLDRAAEDRYHVLLEEREAQFRSVMEDMQAKMAGLESLVKDVTVLKRESTSSTVQIGQLDQLLRAAYAKNASLFGEMFKQGRHLELVSERKLEAERLCDALRRDKRESELTMAAERRRMAQSQRHMAQQVAELQQTVLDLRQLLVRTMDVTDSSSSGEETDVPLPPAVDHTDEDEDEAPEAPPAPEYPAPVMYHRPQRRMLAVPATPPHSGSNVYATPMPKQ